MTMLSFLLPTRNRPERLRRTLAALGRLDLHAATGAEVIVVDDASEAPIDPPAHLDNGLPVRALRAPRPMGAAARNPGAAAARGHWLVMLDDDSEPLDGRLVEALDDQPPEVVAVGARIELPDGRLEAGGLPEVIVGCGCAVRRDAFLAAGGYDEAFHYYAEEYDLCARLIAAGGRIVHDWRFAVRHHRSSTGRDMNVILRRLVRNNGWVAQRYAPADRRARALRRVIDRCAHIARVEGAEFGFERGVDDLLQTVDEQSPRPLTREQWDRFTGRAAAREGLGAVEWPGPATLVAPGKHASVVRETLEELGVEPAPRPRDAAAHVIATLSPGPMMDAWARHSDAAVPALRAWTPRGAASDAGVEAGALP